MELRDAAGEGLGGLEPGVRAVTRWDSVELKMWHGVAWTR